MASAATEPARGMPGRHAEGHGPDHLRPGPAGDPRPLQPDLRHPRDHSPAHAHRPHPAHVREPAHPEADHADHQDAAAAKQGGWTVVSMQNDVKMVLDP
jgi:hypothetical protein